MPRPLPLYMRARCKTGLVASGNGTLAHFPAKFQAAYNTDDTLSFRVTFACGGETHRAVILSSAADASATCEVCEDTLKGPCVYWCFSVTKGLIYIGSAKARLKRLVSHESQSPWWPEVAEVTAVHFPTLFEARVAERLAIKAESPLYNKQHNKPRRRSA
jgi:hypothetical protein